jgi:TonB-dependent receptor
MQLFTKIFILPVLIFLSFNTIFSQGKIKGLITDSTSHTPLSFANAFITGTSLGSSSDIEGDYIITGVPVGKHTVRVSYIGYKSKEFEVEVFENKTTLLDAQLAPEVLEGEEVVITSQALGQVSAINQQLNSNTIVNVVSEEKIQELPDANAGESIGRLPGVSITRSGGEANKIVLRGLDEKFSTITIDGLRIASTDENDRGIDLSTISQGSLAGIELYKALTPDKDADAIAGSVNLVTRKAPEKRLLRLDSKGGYNKLESSVRQYDFNLRYGERLFDNILGVQLNGNIENRIRSNEATNFDYEDLDSLRDYGITNSTLYYTNEIRKRYGFGLILDINTPDSGSIKFNTVFNKTSRDYLASNRNYPTRSSTDILFGARSVKEDIQAFNSFLKGDNQLLTLNLEWGLAFAQSNSEDPYDYQLDLTEPNLDSNGVQYSGMGSIPYDLRHGPVNEIIKYAFNNLSVSSLYDAYDRYQKILDKSHSAFLNISKKYTLSNFLSGEIKVGGKYRSNSKSKNKTEYISPYYLNGFSPYEKLPDGTVAQKNLAGTQFENLEFYGSSIIAENFTDLNPKDRNIYDLYRLFPLINRDYLEEWRTLNINGVTTQGGNTPEYARNSAVEADKYGITERISATYLMNTFNVGRLITFIVGLRVESENNDYSTRYSPLILSGFPSPQGEIRDTSSSHKETIWLPNFHLLVRPFDFMNIRFAGYRALARPDFDRRLPSYILRAAGTFYDNNSITLGNPDLKDAKAWNFEVNTSFFSNYIGLFSVSAFYKEVKDMFHTINGLEFAKANGQEILDSLGIPVTNPFVGDFQVQYQYNSDKPTKVWGFEIEHQVNFWYLPGVLSNIVLSYNFSFIRSETILTSTTVKTIYTPFPKNVTVIFDRKQKLEGQPEFLANVSLGYDFEGFSARVSLFHQGEYNRTFSVDGRRDVVVNAFTRLDLILKQEIIQDHFSATFSINNITNVQEGRTIINHDQGWRLEDTTERYGPTADLSLRFTL